MRRLDRYIGNSVLLSILIVALIILGLDLLFAFPPAQLAAFLLAGIALNLTPGADVIFATASGMAAPPPAAIAMAGEAGDARQTAPAAPMANCAPARASSAMPTSRAGRAAGSGLPPEGAL